MEDLRRQIDALRRRQRLQNILSIGVLVILMFAMGGAETIARTLVESDAWRVKTRKADLSYVDRLVATTDVNRSKLKVLNGNIQLEGETSLPTLVATDEGTLGFDSTAKKLKYWNGTAWVDSSGGGGGGSSVGEETWRLEYTNPTTLTLRGLGNGGGLIDINGTARAFSSNPTLGAFTGPAHYWIYAYWNGSAVALEASSATGPNSTAQYGMYLTKLGDASRRFVGMAYIMSSQYAPELVRSVKNEPGYGYVYKHAPATALNHSTTNSATWTDFDPVITRTGLFFDQERIRAWTSVMVYHPGQWVGRDGRLCVSVGGIACEDSEVGGSSASGGYWAAAYVPYRSEGYVTINGAGLKNIRPLQKAASGGTAQWYTHTNYPASVGFEVLR